MTLIRFPDGQPLLVAEDRARPALTGQEDYAMLEAALANDRVLLAQAVVRDELKHYRFQIGDYFHPTLEFAVRCVLCDGLFPKRGEVEAVRLPKSLGGVWKPMHLMCWLGASSWT